MSSSLIDTHCHLEHIDRDPVEVVAEATQAGVPQVIDIGMGTASSQAATERAARFESQVFAAVGIHPNDPDEFRADPAGTMEALRALTKLPGVVAVGESGLDFYRDRAPRDVQEASFRAHIALAKDVDKALVIHCRDAHDRVLEILDEEGSPHRVVMHCFSGDAAHARACADRGFFCSFAGNLTYKRNDDLREAARVLPDDLVLVETDAPFLAPHPHRGRSNAPALVVFTARTLADVRGAGEEELFALVVHNARRAFELP